MARFFVGQRVRLVRGQDMYDYDEMATLGEDGVIVGGGAWFPDDPEAGYDCIAQFPSYPTLCCYFWQLEPVVSDHQPVAIADLLSEFPSLAGVMGVVA